jgi:hypothetical protein
LLDFRFVAEFRFYCIIHFAEINLFWKPFHACIRKWCLLSKEEVRSFKRTFCSRNSVIRRKRLGPSREPSARGTVSLEEPWSIDVSLYISNSILFLPIIHLRTLALSEEIFAFLKKKLC